jgi:DNA-binding NtrC family response regulator
MPQVLLVDDDANQQRVRGILLRNAGIPATFASNVEEALRSLRSPDGSIALVVTDHHLLGGSGVDLVREIRRADPALPVVVLSGMPGIDCEYEGLQAIVRTKPLPAEDFIELIRQLLAREESTI